MAVNLILYEQREDEYIDMEVSSFLCNSISSPHHSTEFLNLLHLTPPRTPALQMLLKLLQSPDHAPKSALQKAPRPTTTTPSGSSSVSTRMTKKSSLGSKLKACSAYLKSFFGSSGCSDESGAVESAKRNTLQNTLSRSNTVKNREKMVKDGGRHRRSFSIPLKTHSRNKSKSLPCSDDHCQHIRRSTKPEMESPIQGAIAHCKRSQQRCSTSSSREIKIKKDQNSEAAEISR